MPAGSCFRPGPGAGARPWWLLAATALPLCAFTTTIFSDYRAEGVSKWDKDSLARDLDLSGIAWSTGYTPTAVSPLHTVRAAHYPRKGAAESMVGRKIHFVRRDGRPVVRTTVRESHLAGHDITVGLLDAPLPPGVAFYPVAAAPAGRDLRGDFEDCLLLATLWNGPPDDPASRRRCALYVTSASQRQYPRGRMGFGWARVPAEYREYAQPARVGDSGNPLFFVLPDRRLVLVSTFTDPTGGPSYLDPVVVDAVNRAMRELGGGHVLTTRAPEGPGPPEWRRALARGVERLVAD